MPRPEKVQAVAEIKEKFEEAQAVFLTEYRGIPVKEMGNLRRRLRESGAEYKVVKMTLARRAADDLGIEGLSEHLTGPTALAFALEDPVSTAKALRDYARENERLVIKSGYLANRVLEPEEVGRLAERVLAPEEVVRLAEIEPREVLLAKIAGAAKAPLYQMASMLATFTREAASLFSALIEKKEAAGDVSASAAAESESPASPDSADSPESPDSPDSPDSADSPDEDAEAPAGDAEAATEGEPAEGEAEEPAEAAAETEEPQDDNEPQDDDQAEEE